jgi:hypothetical protein
VTPGRWPSQNSHWVGLLKKMMCVNRPFNCGRARRGRAPPEGSVGPALEGSDRIEGFRERSARTSTRRGDPLSGRALREAPDPWLPTRSMTHSRTRGVRSRRSHAAGLICPSRLSPLLCQAVRRPAVTIRHGALCAHRARPRGLRLGDGRIVCGSFSLSVSYAPHRSRF